MPLARHLESLARHVKAGNAQAAKQIAESLMRQYSRKSDKAKIQAALNG